MEDHTLGELLRNQQSLCIRIGTYYKSSQSCRKMGFQRKAYIIARFYALDLILTVCLFIDIRSALLIIRIKSMRSFDLQHTGLTSAVYKNNMVLTFTAVGIPAASFCVIIPAVDHVITIVQDPLFVCVSEFQCRTFSIVDIVGAFSGMVIVENNR